MKLASLKQALETIDSRLEPDDLRGNAALNIIEQHLEKHKESTKRIIALKKLIENKHRKAELNLTEWAMINNILEFLKTGEKF